MKKYLLLLLLAACSGAVDGTGAGTGGGPLGNGGVGGGNFAQQGTLGSQSDIQEMGDECLHPYTLRFTGETLVEGGNWYILQQEQKNFPTPGLVVKNQKEPVVNEEICSDCAGRIVRLIDMGDPGFNPFQEKFNFLMFVTGVRKHFVKPELIAQAVYQDFVVGSVGEVTLKDLPIQANHLYMILLSAKPMAPVSGATSFQNADEFYAVTACSDKPEMHPFTWLRVFQARYNVPGNFPKPIPQDDGISLDNLKDKDKVVIPVQPPEVDPGDPVYQQNLPFEKFKARELAE